MTRTKSFEEIGREADRAERDLALCRDTLSRSSPARAVEMIVVTLTGANWDNGLLALQAKLQEVIREGGEELIHAAFERVSDQSKDAKAELRAAFERKANPDLGRQVPRDLPTAEEVQSKFLRDHSGDPLVLDRVGAGLDPAPEVPPVAPPTPEASGNREAPLAGTTPSLQADGSAAYRTAWNALSPQARELLSWCLVNPGSRFARTPARDDLVAQGYLASTGAGANATWTLTDEGLAVAGARAA